MLILLRNNDVMFIYGLYLLLDNGLIINTFDVYLCDGDVIIFSLVYFV
jgi:hypothetical protein